MAAGYIVGYTGIVELLQSLMQNFKLSTMVLALRGLRELETLFASLIPCACVLKLIQEIGLINSIL